MSVILLTHMKRFGLLLGIVTLLNTSHIALAQQNFWPSLLPVSTSPITIVEEPVEQNLDLDLIVEANTYVPYFYGGRSEPTTGNTARAVVIVPPEATPTSFVWQIGNFRVTTTESFTTFTWPLTNEELQITVTAIDGAGNLIGTISEYARASDPKIVFYETNSLRGTSQVAVRDPLIMIGDEISIKAEPYFFGTRNLLRDASGTWTAAGVEATTGDDWRLVSLSRLEAAYSDRTEVRLDIRSRSNLGEVLAETFNLSL